jgi:hypothetical protein
MIFEDFANTLEEIKRQNDIKRDEGIGYPVILDIRNQSPYDIRDICLKMNISCTAESGDQYLLEFGSSTIELKRNQSLKAIVFDFSGFSEEKEE